jgi:hypothetical protein
MKYRNPTEEPVIVPTALGDETVAPGDEVLTAPKFGNPLVEQGRLEVVRPEPKKTSKSRQSTPVEAAE